MCDTVGKVLQVAILVVLLVLVWKIWKMSSETLDGYTGLGLGNAQAVFTSGATMRRLAQQFSQPSQGVQLTIYNAELPHADREANKLVVTAV